jgi:hypothetical protein
VPSSLDLLPRTDAERLFTRIVGVTTQTDATVHMAPSSTRAPSASTLTASALAANTAPP